MAANIHPPTAARSSRRDARWGAELAAPRARCDRFDAQAVFSSSETTRGEAQLDRSGAEARSTSEAREASDAELVARALAGSEPAFAELVARYNDLLCRHAGRMLGRADDAEDVVQAAWIKAFRRLGQCRDPQRFGAWVFRITSNACKDAIKAERREVVPMESVGDLADAGDGPAEAALHRDQRRRIEAALGQLPPDQREAFLLKHLEGWSYEDMAERLGVRVSALKMRVYRAREELQRLLLEEPR